MFVLIIKIHKNNKPGVINSTTESLECFVKTLNKIPNKLPFTPSQSDQDKTT